MVISISAGGGLVANRPAFHLLRFRDSHLLWGWNGDARRRLKPCSPGTREPTDLRHKCSSPSPKLPGPCSGSLSRSLGRKPEHHQTKTKCYF